MSITPQHGFVIVGNTPYLNSWVEAGRAIRVVSCTLCMDQGRLTTDDGAVGVICDCPTGDKLRETPRPWWLDEDVS